MDTIRQGLGLTAIRTFAFKVNGKGRVITFKEGQRFWVTNSTIDQRQSGFVKVDRHGKGCISHGYAFTPAQVAECFTTN